MPGAEDLKVAPLGLPSGEHPLLIQLLSSEEDGSAKVYGDESKATSKLCQLRTLFYLFLFCNWRKIRMVLGLLPVRIVNEFLAVKIWDKEQLTLLRISLPCLWKCPEGFTKTKYQKTMVIRKDPLIPQVTGWGQGMAKLGGRPRKALGFSNFWYACPVTL